MDWFIINIFSVFSCYTSYWVFFIAQSFRWKNRKLNEKQYFSLHCNYPDNDSEEKHGQEVCPVL